MNNNPHNTNKKMYPSHLVRLAKCRLAQRFITPLAGFVRVGFKHYAAGKPGVYSAWGYAVTHTIVGTYPHFAINYPAMRMSHGPLPNATAPSAMAREGGAIVFTWVHNICFTNSKPNDRAMLVACCPALNAAVYTTCGALRIAGTDALNVAAFAGEYVETYIGFISDDGHEIATSIYTGRHMAIS